MPRWSHTFTIYGQPASWKNSPQVMLRLSKGKGQRCPKCRSVLATIPLKSKAADAWMKSALEQLPSQWTFKAIPKSYQILMSLEVYFRTMQFTDCTSIYDAVQDALEAAGIVENDVCIIPIWCGRHKDKQNPRIEATLIKE